METLTWSVFAPNLERSVPSLVQMGGSRGVLIGYDPRTRRMFLRVPTDGNTSLPTTPFTELDVALTEEDSVESIEISTKAPHLYRELHRFASLLTEDLETEGQSPAGAFLTAIARWQEFSAIRTSLTPDQQVGLLGELVLLEALIRSDGALSVASWATWADDRPGRHDFELPTVDLEVKSTRSRKRVHVIHGLSQLTPAPGRPLYVLSLRLEPSGGAPGKSLPEEVAAIRKLLSIDSHARDNFEAKLFAAGYRSSDEALFGNRFRFADLPRLIVVDEHCPRIDAGALQAVLGVERAALISDVNYRINVDGLGIAEGSSEFGRVLGGAELCL